MLGNLSGPVPILLFLFLFSVRSVPLVINLLVIFVHSSIYIIFLSTIYLYHSSFVLFTYDNFVLFLNLCICPIYFSFLSEKYIGIPKKFQ